MKFKTKTNITAYLEIAPNVFANVDGKAVLEWEFSIIDRETYIDSISLNVPDQTVELVAKGTEIHPETGLDIDLNDRVFSVELSDVEVDNDSLRLGCVVEPEEILKFKNNTVRVEFTAKVRD